MSTRKLREMTPELRAAISAGNRRAWQTPAHQVKQHQGHLGVRPGGRPAAGSYITKQGYRSLTGQWGHPLVAKNGEIGEHRKVLYDKIGPGLHACHWNCGKVLGWGGRNGIVADHLDENKLNNNPENLVASCNPCNRHR